VGPENITHGVCTKCVLFESLEYYCCDFFILLFSQCLVVSRHYVRSKIWSKGEVALFGMCTMFKVYACITYCCAQFTKREYNIGSLSIYISPMQL
jgi:hypothetical protein